ncbi:hypothetical protein DPMN_080485 [Dreissena polymorpha]|uniref:Uncharacterized protein n=1 Tax=Dreissena polymorpha TaxID=45954 RepID=A0A9D3YV79_DREPO|nr:hypothetical protein DPMN_080485 [Dreissena polymorpha]
MSTLAATGQCSTAISVPLLSTPQSVVAQHPRMAVSQSVITSSHAQMANTVAQDQICEGIWQSTVQVVNTIQEGHRAVVEAINASKREMQLVVQLLNKICVCPKHNAPYCVALKPYI